MTPLKKPGDDLKEKISEKEEHDRINHAKIALVCDWLTNVGGAERVLKSLHELYPSAPIYTSKYDKKGIDWFLDADVRTGWLQIFPTSLRRLLGPLRQKYFEHLDLSEYDIIISVTGAEAKSIKKGTATHICYCHVPTQYYWQLYDDYVKDPGFGFLNPFVRFFFKLLVRPLKKADYEAAQRPDYFITISTYARELIKKYYGRDATVIFPPVGVENFSAVEKQGSDLFGKYSMITTSRQVGWKKIDLAIRACIETNWPLTIVGEGPEHDHLVKLAGDSPLITFKPLMNQKKLKRELEKSSGYIFPSLEPFGIAPVEALAVGCPVIAYGKGGALDYVVDGENGLLFTKQTVASLSDALKRFDRTKFDPETVENSAKSFDEKYFKQKIKKFTDAAIKKRLRK